jgi:hypothetical protein
MRDFLGRIAQPPRRQHEDADHVVAHLAIELLGALPVDVEQDVLAGTQRCFDRLARRAVVVSMHLGEFEQVV